MHVAVREARRKLHLHSRRLARVKWHASVQGHHVVLFTITITILALWRLAFSAEEQILPPDVLFANAICGRGVAGVACTGLRQGTLVKKETVGAVLAVETVFNGFGAQVLRLLDTLALARASNADLAIHQAKYWNYGCGPGEGWECYFESPGSAPDADPDAHPGEPPREMDNRFDHPEMCSELDSLDVRTVALKGLLGTERASAIPCVKVSTSASASRAAATMRKMANGSVEGPRRLARQIWALTPITQIEVDVALDAAGVGSLGDCYIGVHVRRGDKSKEVANVPVEEYAAAVRVVAPLISCGVFVATDDGVAVGQLRRLLAPRQVVAMTDTASRTGHDQMLMNQKYLKKNRAYVISLLAEVTALRRATWFVGTFSSNLGRLVHVLRDASPSSSISLDDRWAPGVAWLTFGQPYCRSPDANANFCKWRSRR